MTKITKLERMFEKKKRERDSRVASRRTRNIPERICKFFFILLARTGALTTDVLLHETPPPPPSLWREEGAFSPRPRWDSGNFGSQHDAALIYRDEFRDRLRDRSVRSCSPFVRFNYGSGSTVSNAPRDLNGKDTERRFFPRKFSHRLLFAQLHSCLPGDGILRSVSLYLALVARLVLFLLVTSYPEKHRVTMIKRERRWISTAAERPRRINNVLSALDV